MGTEQSQNSSSDANLLPSGARKCLTCGNLRSPDGKEQCPSCGSAAEPERWSKSNSQYVYAVGKLEYRFPSVGVEKEFSQSVAQKSSSGLTNSAVLAKFMRDPANSYISKMLCWSFVIQNIDTFLVVPRDRDELQMLLDAIRTEDDGNDMDVLVGIGGGVAPPNLCNGLSLTMVAPVKLYSFGREEFAKSIRPADGKDQKAWDAIVAEVLARRAGIIGNVGASDGHRALNYVLMRYPAIYKLVADRLQKNEGLQSVNVLPSPMAGVRNVVDVVFEFRDRQTNFLDRHFIRVDVTEVFPFLVTELSPYQMINNWH